MKMKPHSSLCKSYFGSLKEKGSGLAGWAAGEVRQPELCHRAAVTSSGNEGSRHCWAAVLSLPQVVHTTSVTSFSITVLLLLACIGGQRSLPYSSIERLDFCVNKHHAPGTLPASAVPLGAQQDPKGWSTGPTGSYRFREQC